MRSFLIRSLVLFLLLGAQIRADGPQDNSVENVRPVPPVGIELSHEQREELLDRLEHLNDKIQTLKSSTDETVKAYLPDVQVLHRAVQQAVRFQEMFKEQDMISAIYLLDMADQRAAQLSEGNAPWTRQTGLVVRGFVSELDGTVQPYGLEIADSYSFENPSAVRCDVWFHGRGERSMELHFLTQRSRVAGQYPPENGIVLHPYGRYSNAFKFAGEVDTLEALEHVRANYNIDSERISVRGFSMGGAGCWQFAVHYADQWFAANPGAGFSETPQFLKSFQGETLNPPWYEEKLWLMYDCDRVAANLLQVPTVAYSGEIDKQKQAADVMEAALRAQNIKLTHVIGPQTAHKIHPVSKTEIQEKMDQLAIRGRQRFPSTIDLTTFTLKYNRMNWLTIDGLREHWERSQVKASVDRKNSLAVDTENVTGFSVEFPAGHSPFDLRETVTVTVDGQRVSAGQTQSDLSYQASFYLDGSTWKYGRPAQNGRLRKRHDLQGPIDDALMGAFLFVTPSGTIENPKVREWVDAELNRAVREWRRQMRGDVRLKRDTDITADDIGKYHLILWGTPESNKLIEKTHELLPIDWEYELIRVGDRSFTTADHIPVLISPNPLNPQKYIVYNSSFTYREYDYLNNARQTPKLPDWAIINLDTAPNARWPGKIVDANFFDEYWQLKN